MSKAADAFRTISEVADELSVAKHVLRFWEVKFPQIKPMKRGGGRRYYRPEDVQLLKAIHRLLHGEGYTIRGVQKKLRAEGADRLKAELVSAGSDPARGERTSTAKASKAAAMKKAGSADARPNADHVKVLSALLSNLQDLRADLQNSAPAASPTATSRARA